MTSSYDDKFDYYKRNKGESDPDIAFKDDVISITPKKTKQYEYVLWVVLVGSLPIILLFTVERNAILYFICIGWILWMTYTFLNTLKGENNVRISLAKKIIHLQTQTNKEIDLNFNTVKKIRLRTKYFGGRMAPKGGRITVMTQQGEQVITDISSYDLGTNVGATIAEITGFPVET
jgi:hypothetical protein